MSDIAMNGSDIVCTAYGDISVLDINDDIVQAAIYNIMLAYGENGFHEDIGNMAYGRRMKITDSNLRMIESDCANTIINDDRVASVISLTAVQSDKSNSNVVVSFTLQTEDGTVLTNSILLDMG